VFTEEKKKLVKNLYFSDKVQKSLEDYILASSTSGDANLWPAKTF
jgi:hypothetical protein